MLSNFAYEAVEIHPEIVLFIFTAPGLRSKDHDHVPSFAIRVYFYSYKAATDFLDKADIISKTFLSCYCYLILFIISAVIKDL